MNCRTLDNLHVQRYGTCSDCGQYHWYSTNKMVLGKIDAYNISWKMKKDHMRTKHAKDLLQPIDKKGKRNEDFYKIYGDPVKQKNPNAPKRTQTHPNAPK